MLFFQIHSHCFHWQHIDCDVQTLRFRGEITNETTARATCAHVSLAVGAHRWPAEQGGTATMSLNVVGYQ